MIHWGWDENQDVLAVVDFAHESDTTGALTIDTITPEAQAAFEVGRQWGKGFQPWSPSLRERGWKWRR